MPSPNATLPKASGPLCRPSTTMAASSSGRASGLLFPAHDQSSLCGQQAGLLSSPCKTPALVPRSCSDFTSMSGSATTLPSPQAALFHGDLIGWTSLIQCSVALEGGQRHLRLESRCAVPACCLLIISPGSRTILPTVRQKFHLSHRSGWRGRSHRQTILCALAEAADVLERMGSSWVICSL